MRNHERQFFFTILLFLPIILLSVYYINISYEKLGIPFASFDVALTHFKLVNSDYPPALQTLNQFFNQFGRGIYDTYFISLMFLMCFVIPFFLIFQITNKLEYAVFFLYGTAIGTNHFVVGLLPQAILINMVLLIGVDRRFFIPLLILSFFVHHFGVFIVLIGYLFWRYYGSFKQAI
jgi:hypothetical protein